MIERTIIANSVHFVTRCFDRWPSIRYRIVMKQALDNPAILLYSDLSDSNYTTEHYRLWDRIEHYESSQEGCSREQAPRFGDGDIDDRRSGCRLPRQRADHLPRDPERQAQSLSAEQRLPHQARRSPSMVRGLSGHGSGQEGDGSLKDRLHVYIGYTDDTRHHSVSS